MKKLIFAILATTLTFALSFAGDVIKVLKIYSDGVCTSIPLSGIDSLNHSMYDTDGNLNSDYISTIVHAIDRNYQIPTDKIDSIKVDEIDMQEYDALTGEIGKFVKEQTELEIGTFQDNLLSWLNANDKIKNANINEEKNFISVMLKNGLSYYINFQDVAFFDEIDDSQNSATRAFGFLDENYYDVSSLDDEDIIKSTKFLFAQTYKDMVVYHHIFDFININNSEEELSMIKENIENSPVNLEPDFINDLTIMQKNWNDYGLVIITQTHGIKEVNGFTVVDNRDALQNASPIINIYYKEGKIINNGSLEDDENLIKYVIHKDAIQSKLKFSNTIYLGNYCWSYNFVSKNPSNMYTVIGNNSKSNYNHNPIISNTITSNLFSGLTLIDAYNTKPSNIWFWWNTLQISNESKKRYFSISINEIQEQSEKGNPIIKGRINGYNNLKKNQLDYVVFCHEGSDDFTPDDDDVIKIEIPKNKVNSHGVFNFEIQSDKPLKPATTYRFMFGFEYKGNIYHGETKKFTSSSEPIRAYLEKLYRDTNGDNWTNHTNWCTDAPVREWYGVFRSSTGLYSINLSDNNLVGSIDLSNCPYIDYLDVGGNDIVDLNLENCSLSYLYVKDWEKITYIQSINVSNCKNLSYLDCGDGHYVKNLKSVVAKNCHKLYNFDYSEGELETLDLSNCVSLYSVFCDQNKLKELTLTGCIELYHLDCSSNYLTELELSTFKNLRFVNCGDNRIKSQIPSYLRLFFENSDYLFACDNLYDYYVSEFDMSEYGYTQDKNDPVWWYKENEYGWYFPGEPENHGEYTWPE